MEPINILFTEIFAEALMEQVRAVSPRLVINRYKAASVEEVPPEVWAQTEILYTRAVLPDPELVPRLRWVHLHGAGAEKIANTPLGRSNVVVTNGSGVHAPTMGEYVVLMMLSFGHRLRLMLDAQARAEWAGPLLRGPRPRRELRRATVGIIGYGSLGREVGRLAQAFGMRVLAVNRGGSLETSGQFVVSELAGQPAAEPDGLYQVEQLQEVLPECDYVVLMVPYIPATHRLIDEAALRLMKPEAVVVNVSRGEVVDEAALIRALGEGWIGGAALDVFEQEPLPADSPLWSMENVIISPHVSGWTPRYDERATELFVANLKLYLAGQPLLNWVSVALGY